MEKARRECAFVVSPTVFSNPILSRGGESNKFRCLGSNPTRCDSTPDMVGMSADLLLAECIRPSTLVPKKDIRGTRAMPMLAPDAATRSRKPFAKVREISCEGHRRDILTSHIALTRHYYLHVLSEYAVNLTNPVSSSRNQSVHEYSSQKPVLYRHQNARTLPGAATPSAPSPSHTPRAERMCAPLRRCLALP
jgi:hypothetical protein